MKILILSFLFSGSAFADMTLTKKLTVTAIIFNQDKKYYDLEFKVEAGIYHADEALLSCLQKSLQKQIAVSITYQPMGLKLLKCRE